MVKEKIYKHRRKTHVLGRRLGELMEELSVDLVVEVRCRYVSNERRSILTRVEYEVELARARSPHVIADGGVK